MWRRLLKLRPATDADSPFFWTVRNDPQTISHSWSKREVTAEEHTCWWQTTPDVRYVAETAEGDVGVIRFTELDETTCEVHLAVAAGYRGAGYSTEMLREATVAGRELGYERIVARVDSDNTPSLRAFLRAGHEVESPGTLLLQRDL